MPSHAHVDMASHSYQSLARPEPDRPGVHVDEAAVEIDADAAELLRLRPLVELLGRRRVGIAKSTALPCVCWLSRATWWPFLRSIRLYFGWRKPETTLDEVALELRRGRATTTPISFGSIFVASFVK